MTADLHAPFFLPPHDSGSRGVDYLGMREINLQMMDQLLPGLNNVATRIRPFALLAWTIWVYEVHHKARGTAMSAREYAHFREKIEVLFIFSHRLAGIGVGGIAGADQRQEERSLTHLNFADMGRSSRTTLIEAVNYGPGLKGDGGLHFAYPHEDVPNVFLVTEAGAALAQALDDRLRRRLSEQQYDFLVSMNEATIPTEEVELFARAWDVEEPSAKERTVFFSRLYPEGDTGTEEQLRLATLDLILAVIRHKGKAINAHQLRRAMTMTKLPPLNGAVEEARWRWRALQLRQAQRLAMEVLFGAVERCIWQQDLHTTSQFATAMAQAIAIAKPDWNHDTAIADRLAYFGACGGSSRTLFGKGLSEPQCDLVTRSVELARGVQNYFLDDEVIANAVDVLLLVAVHTEHFLQTGAPAQYVKHAAVWRLPLTWWASTARAHGAAPLTQFLEHLIETGLVSQHLGVAASRSTAEASRMRLSIEDVGIASLLTGGDQCWKPGLARDRVETALALLAECGRLKVEFRDEINYFSMA
jgi:hypothetical protein